LETTIRKEIEALRHMTVAQLKKKYAEVFGEETRSHHKHFLFRRIAWRIQATAEGGLSERARRRALEIANDADLRVRAPKTTFLQDFRLSSGKAVKGRVAAEVDPRLPAPGGTVERRYKGSRRRAGSGAWSQSSGASTPSGVQSSQTGGAIGSEDGRQGTRAACICGAGRTTNSRRAYVHHRVGRAARHDANRVEGNDHGAGHFQSWIVGDDLLIQITPQLRILVAIKAIDGRKGIDSLAQLCREKLDADPFSGCLFIFRSRSAKSIRILAYDGQGFWLATKRLSKGCFRWWPTGREVSKTLRAHQAQLLLAAGNPETEAAPVWRPVSP
jgi:hypothetical protein